MSSIAKNYWQPIRYWTTGEAPRRLNPTAPYRPFSDLNKAIRDTGIVIVTFFAFEGYGQALVKTQRDDSPFGNMFVGMIIAIFTAVILGKERTTAAIAIVCAKHCFEQLYNGGLTGSSIKSASVWGMMSFLVLPK